MNGSDRVILSDSVVKRRGSVCQEGDTLLGSPVRQSLKSGVSKL